MNIVPNKSLLVVIALCCGITTAYSKLPTPRGVEGFEVALDLGLGGLSMAHHPYPITVTIDNQSNREFDGHLVVEKEGSFLSTPIMLPITLNKSSRKRYRFCLDRGNQEALRFSLVADGTVFWEMPPDMFNTLNEMETDSEQNVFRVLTVTPDSKVLFTPLEFGGLAPPGPNNERLPSQLANASCGRAQAYQIPEHDAPLYSFGAVVFGNRARVDQMTADQVTAVARYLIGGGAVFLSRERSTFMERLLAQMPWPVTPSLTPRTPSLSFQAIGLGRLFVYTGFPLISSATGMAHTGATTPIYQPETVAKAMDGPEPRKSILSAIDQLPPVEFPGVVNPFEQYGYHLDTTSPRGRASVIILIVLFAFYTLLTGPMTFAFRKNKARLSVYLGAIVAGFILLSIITGAFLRLRKGDARWTTITELTDDGATQFIATTVRSCAGQRHVLSFEDGDVETWRLRHEMNRFYNYRMDHRRSWSIDLLKSETERDQQNAVHVPLAPWGSDALLSRTYLKDLKPVEWSLNVSGNTPVGTSRIGRLDVTAQGRLKNTMDVPLLNAELIFQIYTAHSNSPNYQNQEPVVNRTAYVSHVLGTLEPGEVRNFSKRLTYNSTGGNRYDKRYREYRTGVVELAGGAALQLPDVASTEAIQMLLVAQLKKPPTTRPGACDFVFSRGTHFIIQRLPVERQPTAKGRRIDAVEFLEVNPVKQPKRLNW